MFNRSMDAPPVALAHGRHTRGNPCRTRMEMTMTLLIESRAPSPGLAHLARRSRALQLATLLLRAAQFVLERVRAFAAARALEYRRRQAVAELQALDDRTLSDIGITRGEIEFAVRSDELLQPHEGVVRGRL
jgi:uncharacterized protein YjiS (DUF1127 family)